jgi:hypothetical protein
MNRLPPAFFYPPDPEALIKSLGERVWRIRREKAGEPSALPRASIEFGQFGARGGLEDAGGGLKERVKQAERHPEKEWRGKKSFFEPGVLL